MQKHSIAAGLGCFTLITVYEAHMVAGVLTQQAQIMPQMGRLGVVTISRDSLLHGVIGTAGACVDRCVS